MMGDQMRRIDSVRAEDGYRLRLQWSDGAEAVVDLSREVKKPPFRPLAEEALFSRVKVGEWGHSVEWTDELAISATSLWFDTLSATGRDDTRAFLEWRFRHGLSLSKAAEALGLSRRQVAYYSNGEKPVPRAILLACKGWEVVNHAA